MSPLVWDLAHVGQQEELWLLRGGNPDQPGMLPPDVDSLYDAFKHRRADRPQLPLMPPVQARRYDHEVRGRVLDLLEKTPEDDLFTAGMVVQHEEQHDETMYATLQLRQGPPARPWFVDALRRVAAASEVIGVRALLIHCENNAARDFYLRLAKFDASPTDPLHLSC